MPIRERHSLRPPRRAVIPLAAILLLSSGPSPDPPEPAAPLDKVERAVVRALDWLAAHQDDDGRWDAAGFMKHDPAKDPCDGPGSRGHDVGVTGLAALTFLGAPRSLTEGKYEDVVPRAIAWLCDQQDPETGLIGSKRSHDFIYDHAIATYALCTARSLGSTSPAESAQLAVDYCLNARSSGGGWRYDVPSIGDSDTSVTGWMVSALLAAVDAGVEVDGAAFEGALAWFDKVSDPKTGRCGYDTKGSLSSRTPANEQYPREKGEANTAIALYCRFSLGLKPSGVVIMRKQAGLLEKSLPVWEPEAYGCDMYYWYYGTAAMRRMGGSDWKRWDRALLKAVLKPQRAKGSAKGSWDPIGPWGYAGGRVYSTAVLAMCLEEHLRAER